MVRSVRLLTWTVIATLVLCAAEGAIARQDAAEGPTVQLDLADSTTRMQFTRVGEFLADGQWDEAVESLRRVMQRHGDRLVEVGDADSAGYSRYLPIRRRGHHLLLTARDESAEALGLYRSRVDPVAGQWYREALERRDRRQLQRVVDEFLASSFGDDALFALGEMALESGRFSDARRYWEQIDASLRWPAGVGEGPAPRPLWLGLRQLQTDRQWDEILAQLAAAAEAAGDRGDWQTYVGTDLPLAEVRARLVLVSILEGWPERARVELEHFRRLHADAVGNLGGRRVVLSEALAPLLRQSELWPQPDPPKDWPTLAGNPARNGRAAAGPDLAMRPAWSVDLGPARPADHRTESHLGFPGDRVAETHDRLLAYHPIVVGSWVVVCDEWRIRAFDLAGGKPAWPGAEAGVIFRAREDPDAGDRPQGRRVGAERFTLTALEGRVFARVGSPVTSWPVDAPVPGVFGALVGLDLTAQGRLLGGFPIDPEDARWTFEGAPVTDGQNVYVAMRRADVQPHAHVACFQIGSGRMLWRRHICWADTPGRGTVQEISHSLLTLDDGTVYFNTNLGVVAALEARTGTPRWMASYPRNNIAPTGPHDRAWHVFRDLVPCLLYRGMVIAAPADTDRIFALDASTGRRLWQTELPRNALDAVSLLGVVDGHLIASGRRLWWFDVYTGRLSARVAENPLPKAADPTPMGMGRGAIAGNAVYWPARGDVDEIFVVDAGTGRQLRQPIPLSAVGVESGNLVVADGYLIVATPDRLVVFSETGPIQPKEGT